MKNRGFTLLETVIVIAISTAMLLALTQLYLTFTGLYTNQQTVAATAHDATVALSALGAAVLPAVRVADLHTFGALPLSSGTSTLVLELPAISASGAAVPGAPDYIGFYTEGTDLYRVIDAHPESSRETGTARIATLVSSLSFTYAPAAIASAERVTVDLTTSLLAHGETIETAVEQLFYLRNK